jgi:hypothetical protein
MDSSCVGFVTCALSKMHQHRDTASGTIFPRDAAAAFGPGPPHYRDFAITLRHTTLGRTPLDEWSAWRGELYLTTHNIRKRQTSVLPAGFESAILASQRPQTRTLYSAATENGQPDGCDIPSLSTIMNKLPESCLNSRHCVKTQVHVLHWTHFDDRSTVSVAYWPLLTTSFRLHINWHGSNRLNYWYYARHLLSGIMCQICHSFCTMVAVCSCQ